MISCEQFHQSSSSVFDILPFAEEAACTAWVVPNSWHCSLAGSTSWLSWSVSDYLTFSCSTAYPLTQSPTFQVCIQSKLSALSACPQSVHCTMCTVCFEFLHYINSADDYMIVCDLDPYTQYIHSTGNHCNLLVEIKIAKIHVLLYVYTFYIELNLHRTSHKTLPDWPSQGQWKLMLEPIYIIANLLSVSFYL